MKISSYRSILLLCVLLGHSLSHAAKSNSFRHERRKNLFLLNINNIIEDIEHRQWDVEESPCVWKTLDILRNVQNHTLWATWVWDSMQNPTGVFFASKNQLGNFHECINPPWRKTHPDLNTQYCLAHIVLTNEKTYITIDDPYTTADSYITSVTKNKLTVNKLRWGLCLPAVCKPYSIKKFAETFLSNSHLRFAIHQASINIDSCQTYDEYNEVPYGYYATWIFIAATIVLALLSTYYYENERHTKTKNYAIILAKAFSIKENTAELFKEKKDEIYTLNSLKWLTSLLILLMHKLIISFDDGFKNTKNFDKIVENNNLYLLFHAEIIVDTYIMISGLLLIKGFLASDKPVNIVNTLIKRYFRLNYVSMIIMLYTTQVSYYHGTGPLAPNVKYLEVGGCREKFWPNLLMYNNYVDSGAPCLPVTWYLPCDFHLTILGTCLFWFYQRNKNLSLKMFFIGTVASVVLPTIVAYQQKLNAIPFHYTNSLEEVIKITSSPIYMNTHLRSGPYFIGLATGFIFSVYKPSNYKKLSKPLSTIIFITSLALALSVYIFGGHMSYNKYSAIKVAMYIGTNRTIWAICISCLIMSCEYGTVPLFSDFLRWPKFSMLSKLSYGIYLTHCSVIISFSTISSFIIIPSWMLHGIAEFSFCCGLTYVLWLLFEAPMNNIVALALRSRSSREKEISTTVQNNVPKDGKKII